jgi:hypothetical protein
MERSEKPCAVLETKELRTNGRDTAETPRSLNPESRRSPRHVCVRQRDGGSALQRRSWSSSARESRAFLRGCDGSVEMCAWALKCAPHPLKKSAPYRQVFSVSQVGQGIQSRAHKDCVRDTLGLGDEQNFAKQTMYKNEHQKWGRQSNAAQEIPNAVHEVRTRAATFFCAFTIDGAT